MEQILNKWNEILEVIEREITAVSFDLWFKGLKVLGIEETDEGNAEVIISTENSPVAKSQILRNHASILEFAFKQKLPSYSFRLLDYGEEKKYVKTKNEKQTLNSDITGVNSAPPLFNPKYTFASFVVGKSNNIVFAAAEAVAQSPGTKFNPLFVYGGVGLGKTHILQAIGNYLAKNSPELKVKYVTCENMLNDYSSVIRQGAEKINTEFRAKYRNVDVLMVDDIQFLINKQGLQDEFFNTFNDLYQNNRQIVLASDRHPRELETLNERLISRFSVGLVQDIQSPEYETRFAILKQKCKEERMEISEKVLTMMAERLHTNIREMEGFIKKVDLLAKIKGKKEVTEEEVIDALGDTHTEKYDGITPKDVIVETAGFFGHKYEDIIGKRKNKEFVEPRQIAAYLITELFSDIPLMTIGQALGGRDHTTIIYSRNKVAEAIKLNPKLKTQVEDLKEIIKSKKR